MIGVKGGEIEKECTSGITIGGIPLEEHLAEEEGKELGEALAPDRVVIYHKGGKSYKSKKESNSFGRIWTRREINKHTWEMQLMKTNSIDKAAIVILLAGREVVGSEIRDYVLKVIGGATNKKYAQRMNYLMTKTDLGKLVERRRAGKGIAYTLVAAALDCRPEELETFAYKTSDRDKVLAHHKGLIPYIQADKPSTKKEPDPPIKDDLGLLTKPGEPFKSILETALSESLGVNVNVTGCIEIKFTFGQ